jgi:CubicO group peptidase (beta-lactamase class C family)
MRSLFRTIVIASVVSVELPRTAVAAMQAPAPGAVPTRASVATADTALLAVRAALIEKIAGGTMPSISIALVRDGRIAWLESLGWADRERGLPADPQTVYSLGSLSKSITATALMRLVDRGRVRLDDPVAAHGLRLPDPLHLAAGLEVRHLLQMTGGIPHGSWQLPVNGRDLSFETARLLAGHGGPVSRPGERFLYSNFSFGALEAVIEHASGRRYEDFLRDEVFRPLGMRRSGADPDSTWRPQVAQKYKGDGTQLGEDYVFVPRGGGGLYSCGADLARYTRLHLGALPADSVLGAAGLARLHDANQPGEPSDHRYMGGWGLIDDGFARSLLSDGQVAGSNTALLLVPDRSIGVVCLVNRSGSDAVLAAIDIVNALLPGYRDAFLAYIERMESAEEGHGANALQLLQGTWAGRVWCGADSLEMRMAIPAQGEPLVTLQGLGEMPVQGAFYSERPDTVVNGIVFRSPGFSGTVAGFDLVARRPADRARFELSLQPSGETLAGSGINRIGDDSVPIVIELRRVR